MSKILILLTFIISILAISGLNSDFNSYYSGRSNYVFVADPPDGYIGYQNASFQLDRCYSETMMLNGVVLTVKNNLLEDADIHVSFEEWIGPNGGIVVNLLDTDFALLPDEVKDIYGNIYIFGTTPEGVYQGVFLINALWDNGSAEIHTSVYPLTIIVNDVQCGDFHTIGYWKNHLENVKEWYLDIIRDNSTIFNESKELHNISHVESYLNPPTPPDMEDRAYQQCMATWLSFALNVDNGFDAPNLLVDTDYSGSPDTTFGDALTWAETNITAGNYGVAKDICDSINNM